MQTVALQARIPKDLKERVGEKLAQMGLDYSAAICVYFRKIDQTGEIPFQIVSKKEPEIVWNPTEEEERQWSRDVAAASLNKLWSSPEDDAWDEFFKNTPSLR